MVRSILEIGNAKYRIDRGVLNRLFREASHSASDGGETTSCGSEEPLEVVFNEVMGLYNEYAVSGRLDVLLKLKCRLEQVSLRYRSMALAEEVLTINSCLPYEWRIGSCSGQDADKETVSS